MQAWMLGFSFTLLAIGWQHALPTAPTAWLLVSLSLHALPARWWTRLGSGACLACALGSIHGQNLLDTRLAADCVRQRLTVTGTVASLPDRYRMRDQKVVQRFEFRVASVEPMRCAGPRHLMLSYYGEASLQPGETWHFEVILKQPRGLSNPGSHDLLAWFVQSGIDASGTVRAAAQEQRLQGAAALDAPHHRVRRRISEHISGLELGADTRAVLQAITVADGSAIDAELWSLFQVFGINHLLVISGLHVGLVAGAGFLLGTFLVRVLPRFPATANWLPGICALAIAGCYAALAGFTLSTQRALYMLACFIVAAALGRRSGGANTLLLAAVAILLVNPLAGLSSGFWLSFGAVSALLWLACWQRGQGSIRAIVFTQAAMTAFMLPAGAWFFGGGSLVAAVANLFMIPLVTWVIVPFALLATLFMLCGWPLESQLWGLAALPLEWLMPPAAALAALGGEWLYRPMSGSLVAVLLALLGISLLVLPAPRALRACALLCVVPILLPQGQTLETAEEATEITVLDVGQGTAVVIRSGSRALLYDTGGGNPEGKNIAHSVVLPFLRRAGVDVLDTMVISHADLDHSAGATAVARTLPVERLRYGGLVDGLNGGLPCRAGEAWRWPGGQSFRFLAPVRDGPVSNDTSCVLQVEVGGHRFLFTGDIGRSSELRLVEYWRGALASDWLLAGHHGSKTSSSLTFLKWVDPGSAVVSSGYANRFGHPHPQVLEHMQQLGIAVRQTSVEGALTVRLAPGEPPRINAHRSDHWYYWR